MSCTTCQANPCCCEPCQETPRPCTFCDRDRKNNVWVEGVVDADGNGGVCLLDTLTVDQVIDVLQIDERARDDLRKVTSDPTLLALADSVPRLPTTNPSDDLQKSVNNNSYIPFYAFRGNPPFAQ